MSDTCAVVSLSAAFAAAPLLGRMKPRAPRLPCRPPRLLQESRRQLSAIPEELDLSIPDPRATLTGDLWLSPLPKRDVRMNPV